MFILSKHFALSEMIDSATAKQNGLVNMPPPEVEDFASEFCERILEPIRDRFGPVVITSGYRSPELNALVGGAASSDHQWTNERIAADFQTPQAKLDEVFDWIRLESGLPFDQVIREHGSGRGGDCIHISYRLVPRRAAMIGGTHGSTGYQHVEVA